MVEQSLEIIPRSPLKTPGFWESKRARARAFLSSGKWKFTLLGAAMFLIALLSLMLFSIGIGLWQERIPKDSFWAKFLVVILVGIVALVPCFLIVDELRIRWRRVKEKEEEEREEKRTGKRRSNFERVGQEESLLDLAIHAVPYGILSLAMLLEYKKFRDGDGEGVAALASIMILFILAELGLFLFVNIRKAEKVSATLENRLTDVRDRLDFLPWINHYLALVDSEGDGTTGLVGKIEQLLGEYVNLTRPNGRGQGGELTKMFLVHYLAEELEDITAHLDEASIPRSVIPPFPEKTGNVSYVATNVGFYATFLDHAVQNLAMKAMGGRLEPTRSPCIAVITNALPSQFWNWLRDDVEAEDYYPISRYREAQFSGSLERGMRIFRVVLVGRSDEKVQEQDLPRRHPEMKALWTEAEWERQKKWVFAFDKNGKDTRPCAAGNEGPPAPAYLVSTLNWTDAKRQTGKRGAYWMFRGLPENHESDEKYKYESIWQYYCKMMHRPSGAGVRGRTEIYAVDSKTFLAGFPQGFNSCPDLMFLGTCGAGENDIWNGRNIEWSIAMMTTMSTQTETMFLTLVHSREKIAELWGRVCGAKNILRKEQRLASSQDVLEAEPVNGV